MSAWIDDGYGFFDRNINDKNAVWLCDYCVNKLEEIMPEDLFVGDEFN